MRSSCHTLSRSSFASDRKLFRAADAIARCARRIWPTKAASELAWRSGCSQRSAENWLAGATSPSAEHLAALLRSDAGGEVLGELMADASPDWWRALQMRARMAEIERRSIETRRLIREMREDADFHKAMVAGEALGDVPGRG